MSDTNNMREEFEVLLVARGASTTHKGDGYGDSLSQSFWVFWQVATERAAKLAYDAGMDGLAHAIRQGGDT